MDLSEVKIAEYSGQRIWMVRAEQGKFFSHFRAHSIISIGHLDKFFNHTLEGVAKLPTDERIRALIINDARYADKKSKSPKLNGSGNKFYNQILHFLHDIKKGDLILTLNDAEVMVGVCTASKAVLRSRPLKVVNEQDRTRRPQLTHRLRKDVEWGPVVSRSAVGGLLKKPFQSRQTVVQLNDFWKEVFGLLYPFFTDGSNIHFSTNIGRDQQINGKVISKLFENLADVQVIAEALLKGKLEKGFVTCLLNDDIPWSQYGLTAKAHFMSKGAIYSTVPLPDFVNPVLAIKVIALVFLLNSGMVEAGDLVPPALDGKDKSLYLPSGLIDERSAARAGTANLDRMLAELAAQNKQDLEEIKAKKKIVQVKKKLRLTIPKNDTTTLEEKAGVKFMRLGRDEE
ncbi:hypothetical protein [Pseudomonas sp. Ps21-P2]|uniref:hypothetical protein n=1 Tax=Pseudomonas sp. Ps21-P2 TaxID=3080331 RepID=UPI00320ADD05